GSKGLHFVARSPHLFSKGPHLFPESPRRLLVERVSRPVSAIERRTRGAKEERSSSMDRRPTGDGSPTLRQTRLGICMVLRQPVLRQTSLGLHFGFQPWWGEPSR